jgi:hypothetical protein
MERRLLAPIALTEPAREPLLAVALEPDDQAKMSPPS